MTCKHITHKNISRTQNRKREILNKYRKHESLNLKNTYYFLNRRQGLKQKKIWRQVVVVGSMC